MLIYVMLVVLVFFFFQAEDGIRDLVRSRGLGDVYKRQRTCCEGGSPADGLCVENVTKIINGRLKELLLIPDLQ